MYKNIYNIILILCNIYKDRTHDAHQIYAEHRHDKNALSTTKSSYYFNLFNTGKGYAQALFSTATTSFSPLEPSP